MAPCRSTEATDLRSEPRAAQRPPVRGRARAGVHPRRTNPGTAPTLLLVHGVGAARVVWAPVLPALAQPLRRARRRPARARSLAGPWRPARRADSRASPRRLAAALRRARRRPAAPGRQLPGRLDRPGDGRRRDARQPDRAGPGGPARMPARPNRCSTLNRSLARTHRRRRRPAAGLGAVRAGSSSPPGSADPARARPRAGPGRRRALRHSTAYEAMLDATAHSRFDRKGQVSVPTAVVFGDRDRILPPPNQHRETGPGPRDAGCRSCPLRSRPDVGRPCAGRGRSRSSTRAG